MDITENTSDNDSDYTDSEPICIDYRVTPPSSSSWIKYIVIALGLSIGYILILVDFVDELIIPPERSFSFMLEEQLLGLIIPNLIVILIAPLIWSKVAASIMNNQVVKTFEAKSKGSITSQPMSLLGTIFGMKTYAGTENYYLEAQTNNTDLSDISLIFKDRVLPAISSNIGITFYMYSLGTLLFSVSFF